MTIVTALLLRTLLLILVLGSVAGLLTGAVLILRPDWLLRASKRLNRWVSTRKLSLSLERTIHVDHLFYRYRRLSGAFIMLGGVYMLYFFMITFDKAGVLYVLSNATIPTALMRGLLDGLVLIGISSAVIALIVSLFLLFRPSKLRNLEFSANKSASLRRALKPLEIPRSGVDEYVFSRGYIVGALLVLGSLYTIAGLMAWLNYLA